MFHVEHSWRAGPPCGTGGLATGVSTAGRCRPPVTHPRPDTQVVEYGQPRSEALAATLALESPGTQGPSCVWPCPGQPERAWSVTDSYLPDRASMVWASSWSAPPAPHSTPGSRVRSPPDGAGAGLQRSTWNTLDDGRPGARSRSCLSVGSQIRATLAEASGLPVLARRGVEDLASLKRQI